MSTVDASIGVAGISYRPADAEEEQPNENNGSTVSGTAVVSFVATAGEIEGGTTESVAAAAVVETDVTGVSLDSTAITYAGWRVVRGGSGGLRFDTAGTDDAWQTLMRLDPE
jgi:hypothetical protein